MIQRNDNCYCWDRYDDFVAKEMIFVIVEKYKPCRCASPFAIVRQILIKSCWFELLTEEYIAVWSQEKDQILFICSFNRRVYCKTTNYCLGLFAWENLFVKKKENESFIQVLMSLWDGAGTVNKIWRQKTSLMKSIKVQKCKTIKIANVLSVGIFNYNSADPFVGTWLLPNLHQCPSPPILSPHLQSFILLLTKAEFMFDP